MNREQKIALILGFAVVLVVGVLVSDHWSGARRLQIADATEGDTGRLESMPVAVLPDPGNTERVAVAIDRKPVPVDVPRVQANRQAGGVVKIPLGGAGTPSPLGEALQAAADRRDNLEQTARVITWQDRVRGMGNRMADGVRNGLPAAAEIEQSPVVRQETVAPATRVVEVPTRQPIRHTVKKNESLYKIAAKYYGDGNRWREIAKANRGRVGAEGGVRTGVTLMIPNATEIASPSRQSTPATRPAERRIAETPTRSKPTTYTVAKNDSLGEISQRFLGTVKRIGEIVKANADKIDNPDDIRVGMVLKIPARS